MLNLESMETLSPAPKPVPQMMPPGGGAGVMLPQAAALPHAPPRNRSSKETDASQGMKYEGVVDWLHYAPGPRAEQQRFTSVSVGDMYWRIVAPIRGQELVRARAPSAGAAPGRKALLHCVGPARPASR